MYREPDVQIESRVIMHKDNRNPGPRARGRRLQRRAALIGAATVIGLFASPVVAAAAPVHRVPAKSKSGPGTPTQKVSNGPTAALCKEVSPSAVSKIVGWTVPAPTPEVMTNMFDAKFNVTVTDVGCSYGSYKDLAQLVTLTYEKLSKPMSLKEVKKDLANLNKSTGANIIMNPYSGLSVSTGFIQTFTIGTITATIIVGVDGTKIAGAGVDSSMKDSEVQSLAELAIHKYL
jgi:hypothetical protein